MPRDYTDMPGALFDIRPVNETGDVDFARMSSLSPQLDLRPFHDVERTNLRRMRIFHQNTSKRERQPVLTGILKQKPRFTPAAVVPSGKADMLRELEAELNASSDPRAVLASAGARVLYSKFSQKSHYRQAIRKRKQSQLEDDLQRKIIAEIKRPISVEDYEISDNILSLGLPTEPVSSNVTELVSANVFGQDEAAIHEWYTPRVERLSSIQASGGIGSNKIRKALIPSLLCIVFVFAGAKYGIGVKDSVIERSISGVEALESAKENLKAFDFVGASEDFSLAYERFVQAGKGLNVFGASISSLISEFPGGGKLQSANGLIEIGKLIADAGQAMSDALDAVAKTGVLLNPQASANMYLSNILAPVHEALSRADQNLARISSLMGSVNLGDIPGDKREQFEELNTKLPELREMVGQALGYVQFVERLAGSRGEKRYIVLFQNTSELRPTGGFPGSYGIMVFEDGKFKEIYADDVYNIDGQLRELYVPPLQLQHITPNWAMRDAAWFIDFNESADKVMMFYEKESGRRVDGVITINPKIVSHILDSIGGLAMPEYGLTLTGKNFLSEVQNEVEYGENKTQDRPKQIIIDMVPRLLAKLISVDRTTWLSVVQAFMAGMDGHDILMHFTDEKLQQFVRERGFAGNVENVNSDYLMVALTNIKGSKADAVTDTSLVLNTRLEQSSVRQMLAITRRHNGGKSKYGFYNKQNPSFVRVLVPKGSKLIRISGNSSLSHAPMMNYPKTDFLRDPDLERLEATMRREQGIIVFEESGKTEFGFWMVVDPGEIKTVEIEYEVPAAYARSDYELYVQKQPGLELSQFEWILGVPSGRIVSDASPRLTVTGGEYRFVGTLPKNLLLKAVLE